MIQAVVFDAGETLVNETRQWRMWAEWLKVPEQVLFAVLGAVIEQGEHHRRVFEILRPGFDLDAAREERRRNGIPDAFDARDLYPDARDCVNRLRERGFKVGIAGNHPDLPDLGLSADFIASSSQWNVAKPSRQFFQRIVDEVNLPAASIAYVGDRLDNDILPALEAGMIAVFIKRGPWGYLHSLRPDAARAHLRIESLTELPEGLDRLNTGVP